MADHWFFKYLVAEKWSYIQAILASVFINIFSIVTGLYIMVVYNRILPNASFGPSAYYTLTAIVIGVGSIIVVDYIFKVLRAYFLDKSGSIMEKKSSNDVFDKIESLLYKLDIVFHFAGVNKSENHNDFKSKCQYTIFSVSFIPALVFFRCSKVICI